MEWAVFWFSVVLALIVSVIFVLEARAYVHGKGKAIRVFMWAFALIVSGWLVTGAFSEIRFVDQPTTQYSHLAPALKHVSGRFVI